MITYYATPAGVGNALSPDTPGSIVSVKNLTRSAVTTDNVTIYLRGGTYQLTETLQFSSLDSGSGGRLVTWQNYPGETPILSGAVKVTGWTLHDAQNNIWKAVVPSGVNARQLYVNGIKAVRSNMAVGTSIAHSSGATFQSTNAAMPVFSRPQDLEFSLRIMIWAQQREFVSSVTRVGNTTTFNLGTGISALIASGVGNGSWPAYPDALENAYEFLSATAVRQWYLNPDTNTLYYVPGPGEEDLNAQDIRLPVLERLISCVQSDAVTDVFFKGITFAYTGWLAPTTNRSFLAPQANIYMLENNLQWFASGIAPDAAVNLFGAQRVNFAQCTFTHLGGQGIHFGAGSKNCTVEQSTFDDIASSGIFIGEVTDLNPDINNQVSGIIAKNNIVRNIGLEYLGAPGIFVGVVDHTKVLHNEISACPYTGISLGWGWLPSGYANNNEIAYNKIHDILSSPMHDGAGVYTLGHQGQYNRSSIHDNYIYNVGNQPNFIADSGIYADEGTHYIDIYNNIIIASQNNTPGKWFFTNGQSADNTAYSNYQYGGLTYGQNGAASLVGISAASSLNSSNPSLWPVTPQNIALSAGPETGTTTTTTTTTTSGPTTTTTPGPTTTTTPGPTTTTTSTTTTTTLPPLGFNGPWRFRSSVRVAQLAPDVDGLGPFRIRTSQGIVSFEDDPTSPIRIMTSLGVKGIRL